MDKNEKAARDGFRTKLKEEWSLMWNERFDDKVRAEGVAVNSYPLLFVDRGHVITASRDVKAPSFSEVVDYWSAKGLVYSPPRYIGGWGRFVRTELKRSSSRAAVLREKEAAQSKTCDARTRRLKKGGRGWLHKR